MPSSFPPLIKVFISYSHQDIGIKKEIERNLLSNKSDWELQSDDLLQPGSDWNQVLTTMRDEADVFLLLVSAAYLGSKTIHDIELPQIMGRAGEGGVYVMPVILEKCDWHNQPFAKYQALPKFGHPMHECDNREEAFLQIKEALLSVIRLKQNNKASQIIKTAQETRSTSLDLSLCNLTNIPRVLLEMPWLLQLNLEKNFIKKIENLDNLTQLEELILVSNEIEQVDNLDNLEKLSRLDLQYNNLTGIGDLASNTNLTSLGLSSNRISSLAGISQLQKLTTLYAAHNQLKQVDELAQLPHLQRVVLTNNQIQSVKPLLNHIRSGLQVALKYSFNGDEQGIFIKDNKALSEPSIEVIEKGRDAILKYFADAEMYGTRKLEILKLILVGNSKVGKSNFSEFVRGLSLTVSHNSTHLLDIQRWDTSLLVPESGNLMRVNIFDFGGQDYYHDLHRMYYSHDTAYILLWDTTTNKYSEEIEPDEDPENTLIYENFPLEYWLESIKYNLEDRYIHEYGDDARYDKTKNNNTAPVLILQNKIDIREGRLDQEALSEKYENISGFFNISLAEGKRTKVLFEVLSDYMNALNLAGRQLIAYEHKIIEYYLDKNLPFDVISLDEFCDGCIGIINDHTISFNKDNARIIAEILNAIGIIFYDKQSATDGIIFTRINELNELIKQVMDVARKGNDKGIFSTARIEHIAYREEIVQLLIRNNSIIPINTTDFLVPQFLPTKPAPSVEFFLTAFTFCQVRFIYKAYFHKTLLLSVFSTYLSGTVSEINTIVKRLPFWRNGIIVSRGEGSAKQMVFVEFIKTETMGIINIKTMAPYSKRGLERDIENTLDKLSKGWSVSKEISANGTDFFDVAMLKEEVENGQYQFSADKKMFSANDFKNITDFTKLPKKLFISYSSKNAEFIKRFVTHLEILKSAGLIEPWYDRMIESGTKWDDTIRTEMRQSDIIIFLLSPDFLATEYIMKTEIPMAIEQMKNDSSKFFFIELQPCGWKRTDIRNYQQTDDPDEAEKNVIKIGQPDNDEQWNKVIDQLEKKMS